MRRPISQHPVNGVVSRYRRGEVRRRRAVPSHGSPLIKTLVYASA